MDKGEVVGSSGMGAFLSASVLKSKSFIILIPRVSIVCISILFRKRVGLNFQQCLPLPIVEVSHLNGLQNPVIQSLHEHPSGLHGPRRTESEK